MEKTNGYYVAKYLKNNALVLVCELVIVLLLSLICTIIMEAEPLWLAPAIAVVTYLVAEVRFMMAYVATNARHEHEMAKAKGENGEQTDDADAETEQTEEDDTAVAAVMAAAAMTEDDRDDEAASETAEQASEPTDGHDEQTDEGAAYDEPSDESQEDDEQANEPVFDDAIGMPVQDSIDMDDEDEAVEALFATVEMQAETEEIVETDEAEEETVAVENAPVRDEETEQQDEAPAPEAEQKELVLESIEMSAEDDVDDMTMDDDDFARDVLEIGEIEETPYEDASTL